MSSEVSDDVFPDYHEDFIDHEQVEAFANALDFEEEISLAAAAAAAASSSSPHGSISSSIASEYFDSTRNGKNGTNETNNQGRRTSIRDSMGKEVPLIESQHDWLPIYKRLKKRPSNSVRNNSPAKNKRGAKAAVSAFQKNPEKLSFSISFKILRYPMLFAIMSWVVFLFLMYVLLRFYVSTYESIFNWRGEKHRLRKQLEKAQTYEEWIEVAQKLDKLLGMDQWKKEDKYFYYDYRTLRKTVNDLSNYRQAGKVPQLMSVLQSCLKANFAGTENILLYSKTYYGTKNLIRKYNDEVVAALNFVAQDTEVDPMDKKLFFRTIDKNFGRSALCLSGGASFAYNHFGIIKALIENDSLPKILSGTSGGGIVAALACSRTDEELKQILNPKLANKITACDEPFRVWFKRWRQTGARFDTLSFAKKAFWFTRGGLTFKEMYKKTGKRLNISTVPSDPHSPVILCNEITSPNCLVWSSLLASAAVPGILNPVVLMMKDNKTGEVLPYSFGNRWKDGSLRTDIPVEALNNYYNVKFSIVSQVNPHISLFSYAPKGSVGNPVTRKRVEGLRGGFLIASLEHLIKLDITKWLKLIKSLDLFPRILDQDWSNVWLQKFSGTITVWPKLYIKDLYYILADPDEARLATMLRNGELSTYPKLLFIKHRLNIERAIERGRKSAILRDKQGTVEAEYQQQQQPQSFAPMEQFSDDEDDEESEEYYGQAKISEDESEEEGQDIQIGIEDQETDEDEDDDNENLYTTDDDEVTSLNKSRRFELFDDEDEDEDIEGDSFPSDPD